MHREIEFRGKSLVSGEWVYGYYYKHSPPMQGIVPKDYVSEKPESYILRTGFADWNMYRPIDFTEVYPETIGQYTGLTDKNGTEIYESDIVRYRDILEQPVGVLILEQVGVVEIYKGMIGLQGITKQTYKGEIRTHECKALLISPEIYEVIGNIHDNPELLEVE